MMGPLAQYLIPLAIVGAAQAVTVKGYWTDRCQSPGGSIGMCTNIPENHCCVFAPEAHPFSIFSGNTRSVEWTRFSECQLLQWWNPNSHPGSASVGTSDWNCHGSVRDTFTTGAHVANPRHCMSSNVDQPPFGQRHDGATWYVDRPSSRIFTGDIELTRFSLRPFQDRYHPCDKITRIQWSLC
jgi:hypothetical protein